MLDLRGIVPPMITPLNEDETLDVGGLERQVSRLLDAGIHGIFLLGSNGEQPSLRDAVRAEVIRETVRVNRGRVPVIVGTMASSTARAIDNIRMAEAGGADAVAVTAPHYYPSRGEEEQLAHFRACAAATRLPVVVYNIPSTTKVALAPETIARVAELPNVAAVKDSTGDLTHVLKILAYLRGRERVRLLVGIPPIAGAAMLYGASGSVPGIANVDPLTMIGIYDAARAGNISGLIQLQERVHLLMRLVTLGAGVVTFKVALEMLGVCQAHATQPFQPLSPGRREEVGGILRELGLLS